MKWHATFAVIVVCLAGCHAPRPSFDLLAPYGSSRVPAPSTGSHGTGNAYYTRSAPPATAIPGGPAGSANPASSRKMQTNTSDGSPFLASDESWKPIRTIATPEPAPVFPGESNGAASSVVPVSYPQSADAGTSQSSLRLNGVPLTDASRAGSRSEPARFRASGNAIEISQLPRASSDRQHAMGTVVSSARSSDRIVSAASESSASKTTLKWRSRSPND